MLCISTSFQSNIIRNRVVIYVLVQLLLLLLFKTLQCTYVYLYHTYKPLQRLSSQVALMVHRQLGLWPMLCILYKLLQLIKNIKVSGGGLIVTLGATALKRKVTGI